MSTQTQWIFGFSIIIALFAGILIGKSYATEKLGSTGSHVMPDGTVMMNHGNMESMMGDMNAALSGKTGDAFDKAFLEQMVVHHEGAVSMAQKVLEVSKRPELIKLAHDIIDAQTKEIKMMNDWKATWFHK